jgi:CRISPR-associated protein Cmr4
MKPRLVLIHALSPVHCGTGQAVGGIDLPIAREKPTNIPLVPGSSIKGVLRAMSPASPTLHRQIFGPDTESASDNAGSVQISDANLVFLPVRSLRGTFAWVTSPYILRRLDRDARECGIDLGKLPPEPEETQAIVTGGTRLSEGSRVVFEDLDFAAREEATLETLAGVIAGRLFDEPDRAHFGARVCLVHDDVMALLLQTSTEITMRVRLEPDRKTVADGALWSEEALPIESVLAGLCVATPVKQKGGAVPDALAMLDYLKGLVEAHAVQLGGKATVGRGLCRMRLAKGEG